MTKLTALLVAAIFSLSAMPASATQYDESLAMVPAPEPAPKAVKSAKKHKNVRAAKHKNIRKAKHKNVRKAKPKHVKASARKRLLHH